MSGKLFVFPGRVGIVLIGMAILGAMTGCAPKLPTDIMSAEDLQTCDDLAVKMGKSSDVSMPSSNAQPYLVKPGVVEITSPLSGSILPYTASVIIKFKQPPADAGVLYRNYRVIATPLIGSPYLYVGDQYAVVTQPPTEFQLTWTPPGAGKYILYVLIRNLETIPMLGGNTAYMSEQLAAKMSMSEDFDIHYGPFSMAYACIKIDNPKVGGLNTEQPAQLMPLENITLPPTETRTVTPWPTITNTLTFTPLTPTLTATFTPRPPTKVPPSKTPTNVPPTPVVCSNITDKVTCENNRPCVWGRPPTGGPEGCT